MAVRARARHFPGGGPLERDTVVDLRTLTNAHARRGVGRYVRGLLDPPPPGALVVRERRGGALLGVRRTPDGWLSLQPDRPRMRLDPVAALVLRGALERARPGLVHLTDPYTAHLAPRGVPVLMTVYDLLLLDAPGRLPALFTRGIRSLQARQDVHWLAISTTVAREVQQRLGVVAASLTVASPGPTAWPDSGATPYDGLLVVGALDAHKRPEHAVEAARAAGLPVLFAGRHEPQLVEVLGLAPASLAADLDDAALAARIRGARAVVHASSSEGFGLPVLEALSLETPVIAYDLPVTREIVGPDYPLVPEAEGPAGLARLAGELADPAVRAAALAAAAPTVAGHSWQRSRDVVRRLHAELG